MENYEQKYKAALNWMRSIYPTMQGADREDAEHYFPELKESEDEKIRKEITRFLINFNNGCYTRPKETDVADWIAWLEKQGEKKPAISDEALHEGIIKFGITQYQIDNWLKKHINVVKQKSAWSEEDEKRFEYCKRLVYASDKYSVEDREETVDWLKSIKDRVQPQPKQEWSKEDKSMYIRTLGILGKCYMGELPTKVEEELNWFKSIEPKSHWKPSEEQIKSLRIALQTMPYSKDKENVLVILEELNKL